jgi:Ca2+-binding EF-hand superfamily protein
MVKSLDDGLQAEFEAFDVNADGVLGQQELGNFLTAKGFRAPDGYIEQLIATYGEGSSDYVGRARFGELVEMFEQQ